MKQNMAYPWLHKVAHQLEKLYQSQKFPHALLLVGQEGLGQESLVTSLSQLLLCLAPNANRACGHCRSCYLLSEQHHPDFRYLGENNVNISIDDVREIITFLSQASHQSGNRVVVIVADNLTLACANALLKTLEEPPNNTFFILLAKHQSAVLPTVKSRCFVLSIPVPSYKESVNWLQQQYPTASASDLIWQLKVAGGVPLTIQPQMTQVLDGSGAQLAKILCAHSPSEFYAEDNQRWLMSDTREALYLLYYWVTELILFIASGTTVFTDTHATQLASLSHLSPSRLFEFLDSVVDAIQVLKQPGINKQLLLESLFNKWYVLKGVKNEHFQLTAGS